MPTVLFHRDYRRFQGGHLKVWDYFNHVAASGDFSPQIYFEPGSLWDATNPWSGVQPLSEWEPLSADILFLGGVDWRSLPEAQRGNWPRPVINLIQHVRHANPAHPLYSFLPHRAVRICVSQEIADAITATGKVNGPVFTIPNGIEVLPPGPPLEQRPTELLIAGLKNPELARQLTARFAGRRVVCLTELMPRPGFLEAVANSQFTLFLPGSTEGFYLPALEGMAIGTVVICPDCVGNRSFCLEGENCFRPEFAVEALVAAVERAFRLDPTTRKQMLDTARATALAHGLEREREAFLAILRRASELWICS